MKKYLGILLLLVFPLALFANGWHVVTRYYTIPSDETSERVEEVFLYNGYMKMVAGDLTTVFDLAKNEITYTNKSNRTYWKGNPSRFLLEVRAELEASVEERLASVPKDQQEEQRAMYKEMIEASFPSASTVAPKPRTFAANREGATQVVSGFTAEKYTVTEDGYPLENLWLALDLPIAKDFDFISLSHFLNQLAQGAYAGSFESSQEYFKLLKRGYPVKVEIKRGDGSIRISEVKSAQRVALGQTDFTIPKGYTPSNLTNVGVWDGYM